MKHELWYSVVVRDRYGKVVSRERRKARSLLKAWNQLIYTDMSGVASTITDTGGTPRSVAASVINLNMRGFAGVTNYGIRVGTGTTPVALDDYALEAPIEEGTGAGQMEHRLMYISSPTVAPPSCYFLVPRFIVNNSPGEITVREAAIYVQMSTFYGCVARDVFGTPQAVPIGGTITMDWTIQVTV